MASSGSEREGGGSIQVCETFFCLVFRCSLFIFIFLFYFFFFVGFWWGANFARKGKPEMTEVREK